MRGDEGSLKGVEQKVHAAELAVKSYTSLRITDFSIHQTVSPRKSGACVARDGAHHSGARAKGSSLQITVPSEIPVVATKPFPLFWSKYSTRRERPFCVYLRGSRPSRSLLEGDLSTPAESEGELLTVLTKPRLWRTFRVRFSLTSHPGFFDNNNAWSFGIPRAGFSPRSAARAEVRSESEGEVRVSDIPDGKPRLDFGWR